jgi:3-phenylpropionate/trans-cinnamate dioxygenase ferredoxin reductase subunit
MIQRDYLIVGAGLAGACTCEGIRNYDPKGSVTLVGFEPFLPYDRPPLSKNYLKNREEPDQPLLHPESWYRENDIELRLNTMVRALNIERHLAVLDDGQTIQFKKACLATGSRPVLPQVAGARLGNVFYLRSIRDARAIREIASTQKQIVIVGGGFIAIEAAASLKQLGMNVALLNRNTHLWEKRIDAETAEWLTNYMRDFGVKLMMREDLKGFEGKTALKNVATKSGQRFACGMALVAVGAEPNTELVLNTPLHSPFGTPVNEFLESDEKGIFAAGDIALFPDKIFGGARRIEHWDNAKQQGLMVGGNMTGRKRQRYDYLPYFFSDVFDLSFEFYGDFSRKPVMVNFEGDRSKKKFIARYSESGKLRGVLLCNQDPEVGEMIAKEIRDSRK